MLMRGATLFLAYNASEMDDANVRTNTQANIDAFVNNQKVNNADVVVWYAGHINHNRGMFNLLHPHSISGALVTGPDLIPLRWCPGNISLARAGGLLDEQQERQGPLNCSFRLGTCASPPGSGLLSGRSFTSHVY